MGKWSYETDEIIASNLVSDMARETTAYLKNLKENRLIQKKPIPFRGIASVFITFAIISLLLMSGPANAFTVTDWKANNDKPVTGSTVVIDVDVSKLTNEVMQADSAQLKITDSDGNIFIADFMNCTPAYYTNQGYGYGSYGYNAGFGYGYGYGYGGTANPDMKCKFKFKPETGGEYNAQLFINGHLVGEKTALFAAREKIKKNKEYNPASGLTIKFDSLPGGDYYLEATHTTGAPPNSQGFDVLGNYYEITSNLANGDFSATITIAYPDADNDGFVDGTNINENDLKVYYFNSTGWNEIPKLSQDTTANTITIASDHFTLFAVMAPVAPVTTTTTTGTDGGNITGGGSPPGQIKKTGSQTQEPATNPTPLPTQTPAPAESTANTPSNTTPQATAQTTPADAPAITPTGFLGLEAGTGSVVLGALVVIAIACFGFVVYKTKLKK